VASSFFWNLIAQRYSKQPVPDEAAYQKKLQITRDYLQPDMEVLEFGCGSGSTALAHAPYVKHIQAIDFSAKMIAIAQGKADAENIENVTFRRASIDEINVADQALDVVMGHSILHLLDNRRQVIAKIYRMLKPGGVFISSTICIADEMKYFRFIAPIFRIVGLTLQIFTTKELQDSFIDAGFAIDHQWQPPGKGKSVFMVARKGK